MSNTAERVMTHYGQGPVKLRTQKDPDAVLDYRLPWGDWLDDEETISSTTWTSDGVFTIDSSDVLATDTVNGISYTHVRIVWLSGGIAGETGTITCRITTNQGRTQDRSFQLTCAEQ